MQAPGIITCLEDRIAVVVRQFDYAPQMVGMGIIRPIRLASLFHIHRCQTIVS
ncbi:MAG: hypothetical protein LBQ60_01840 [Bacteroidales bacterium]|nr:hypothetical protein [Bacteroidales bacterium]